MSLPPNKRHRYDNFDVKAKLVGPPPTPRYKRIAALSAVHRNAQGRDDFLLLVEALDLGDLLEEKNAEGIPA